MAAFRPEIAETAGDGLVASLARLAQLELELGLAEARRLLVSAAIAVALAVEAAIALIASLVVLLAAVLAVPFGARWEPLLIAGGATVATALGVIAWSVTRLRSLDWPRLTLASLEENWRWLGAQLRSRLTLR